MNRQGKASESYQILGAGQGLGFGQLKEGKEGRGDALAVGKKGSDLRIELKADWLDAAGRSKPFQGKIGGQRDHMSSGL